jgi:hypothetical protein
MRIIAAAINKAKKRNGDWGSTLLDTGDLAKMIAPEMGDFRYRITNYRMT